MSIRGLTPPAIPYCRTCGALTLFFLAGSILLLIKVRFLSNILLIGYCSLIDA